MPLSLPVTEKRHSYPSLENEFLQALYIRLIKSILFGKSNIVKKCPTSVGFLLIEKIVTAKIIV